MKSNINLIDLDGTLIPYDSFRKYVFIFLKKPHMFFYLSFLIILRTTRIISLEKFKELVIKKVRKNKDYNKIMEAFSLKLYNNIKIKIKKEIDNHSFKNTINVLCTASPSDYALKLADKLGWNCICSQFNSNNKLIHIYGKNKLTALQKIYPSPQNCYYYAISNSLIDKKLLSNFMYGKLLTS